MAEQPEIDPRYDPAFQRGYDGAVATGSRSEAASRRTAPHVTSALQRATVPSAAPRTSETGAGFDGIVTGSGAAPAQAPADATAVASASPVVQVAAPALRAPWTNPFAIAVTIVGIGVLGVGVWLLQETFQMTQSETGFQTQTDYWFMQWGMIAAPIFVALGIAILVSVLVMCAVYWGRRPDAGALDE
ncbi:MAG: hypothetical protein ACTHMQ_08370 [Protaetiibacter sp.]